MPVAFTMAPLAEERRAALEAAFNATRDAETRLRYQMVVLGHQGKSAPEIGRLTLRDPRVVIRALRRFAAEGVGGVPYRVPPGGAPTVTAAWRAELVRVVEESPRTVGVACATWTTTLLGSYLAEATGVAVGLETVRRELHAAGYVCKRPTWTLKRRAQQEDGYAGNARGWRRC